jgi:hypothetical protein
MSIQRRQWQTPVAFAVILLLLIIAGFFLFRPVPSIRVIGNLPAKDLAEIKSFARHQIWKGTFPNFSWKSIKGLPSAVNSRWHTHLVRVEVKSGDTVEAILAKPGLEGGDGYILKKGPKGWTPISMELFL